jgi:hypothetical protein
MPLNNGCPSMTYPTATTKPVTAMNAYMTSRRFSDRFGPE